MPPWYRQKTEGAEARFLRHRLRINDRSAQPSARVVRCVQMGRTVCSKRSRLVVSHFAFPAAPH